MSDEVTASAPLPPSNDAAGDADAPTPALPPTDVAAVFAVVLERIKVLVAANDKAGARRLCQRFIAAQPSYAPAWLHLLRLDVAPPDEMLILEQVIRRFPDHPLTPRLQQRLAQHYALLQQEEQRVMALLHDIRHVPSAPPPPKEADAPQRLGAFLLRTRLITAEQLHAALREQQRRSLRGEPVRLGVVLVLQNTLSCEQLATALVEQPRDSFGELGDFLVWRQAITRPQMQTALMYQLQATIAAEYEYVGARAAWELQRTTMPQRTRPLWRRTATGTLVPPHRSAPPRLGDVLVSLGYVLPKQIEELLYERERIFNAWFA